MLRYRHTVTASMIGIVIAVLVLAACGGSVDEPAPELQAQLERTEDGQGGMLGSVTVTRTLAGSAAEFEFGSDALEDGRYVLALRQGGCPRPGETVHELNLLTVGPGTRGEPVLSEFHDPEFDALAGEHAITVEQEERGIIGCGALGADSSDD